MSLPASVIVPEVGVSRPATIRSVVVLPQPDGPSSAKNDPRRYVEVEVVDRRERGELLGHPAQPEARRTRLRPVGLDAPVQLLSHL